MGRHTDLGSVGPDDPDGPVPDPLADGRDRRRRVLVPALVVLALAATAATGVVLANPGMVVDRFPGSSAAAGRPTGCHETPLRIAAAPEVAVAVTTALAPLRGSRLEDDNCLDAEVLSQPPAETLRSTTELVADRLPALWIPDSSLWLGRVTSVPTRTVGSFALSPVVIATGTAVVTSLGWGTRAPTWKTALDGRRAVAMPDPAQSATGLLAVLALRTSAGGGTRADQAVAATVLASQRADAPTAAAAFRAAAGGAPSAPLVPAAEQAVVVANRAVARSALVAVYPSDGSPSLDYPVVRLAPATTQASEQVAVDAVVRTLLAPAARDVARAAGFRAPDGTPGGSAPTGNGPSGIGARPGTVSALALPPADQIKALLDRLTTLAEPIRMLTLIDISPSMGASAGPAGSRIELVRDAAKGALQLLPDGNQVGAWAFSANLAPGVAHIPIAPMARLDAREGSTGHRASIIAALDRLPASLAGTGTALYATTLDAVTMLSDSYDTSATNVAVLLTDGTDENAPGLDLKTLVTRLAALDTPRRPVRLIAVGIGPTADMTALRAMAAATPNGRAYQATSPEALQAVLFDALSSRR